MDYTQKRKKTLINMAYYAIFAVIYFLFVKYAFWIAAPFIIAFIIAMLLQRPIGFISTKTHIPKKFWSVILVLLIVAVLLGLVTLLGYLIGSEFYDFGKTMMAKFDKLPSVLTSFENKLLELAQKLPGKLETTVGETIKGLYEKVMNLIQESETDASAAQQSSSSSSLDLSTLTAPLSGLLSTAKRIPSILTAFLIAIISCFFMTSDYDGFVGLIKHSMSREHSDKLSQSKHVIINVLGKWCKSYAILLFCTFCEVSLGLYILKLAGVYTGGYIFVIAICTAILDILPVFGTGTILIPWAIFSLFTHNLGLCISLLIIYASITVIRQVLEPRLVSMNVNMHPVVTLMSMYIGIQAFGVMGIIVLPITVVIVKTLNDEGIIHLWGQENREERLKEEINPKPPEKNRKKPKKRDKKKAENADDKKSETVNADK